MIIMISASDTAKAKKKKIIVGAVIPAYNAGDRISDVLLKIQDFIPKNQIVVIDDGSGDPTAEIARKVGVHVVRHAGNFGKGSALRSGFIKAVDMNLDAVFTLDADGQHDPRFVPAFLQTMRDESSDLVIGRRSFRIGEMPLDRILSNRLSSAVVSAAAGKWIPDSQNGYRLIGRKVLESVDATSNHYEFESEFLIRAVHLGFKLSHCAMSVIYEGAESHIHRARDTFRFQKMIIRLLQEKIRRSRHIKKMIRDR